MHFNCHQTSDFWQLRELASSGLLISVLEIPKLVSFDWSDSSGAIDVKMGGSALEKKSSFKMLGLSFLCKFDWGSNVASKKMEFDLFYEMFFSLGCSLYKSTI